MHINAGLFNIHQRHALLAAGPRPHGSMRSLPRSFVWHGCRCLEHEIKLVTVIGNTYMVVNLVCVCLCVWLPVRCGSWSRQVMLTSPESVTCWRYSRELGCLQVDDEETKVSPALPALTISERETERERERECEGVWGRECIGGSCNWVLIELAPKEGWMDGEVEKERVWGNRTSSSSPLSNTDVSSPCRRDFTATDQNHKPLDLKVSDGTQAFLVILMKIRRVLSPIPFKWSLFH